MYQEISSFKNLYKAYKKARKNKTRRVDVQHFTKNLTENLLELQKELEEESYQPQPLQKIVIQDPKTRTIHKASFRDRVVHHAVCNIIAFPFEKQFIHDSYANQKGKGTIKAIKRYEVFARKATKNYTKQAYYFKADIAKYFASINHGILLNILERRIKEKKTIGLINKILKNYDKKGMPLGNLTSQFFANVYLHQLDFFIKHRLKVKYYLRYVDDFAILHENKGLLQWYKFRIEDFLQQNLKLVIHPQKCHIKRVKQGITFLGFRIYKKHKRLARKNMKKWQRDWKRLQKEYKEEKITYDKLYEKVEGWCAFAKQANTYKKRQNVAKELENISRKEVASKEMNKILKAFKQQNHTT